MKKENKTENTYQYKAERTFAFFGLLYEAILYMFLSTIFGFGCLALLVINGVYILPSIFISLFGSAHMMLFMVGSLEKSIKKFKQKYGDL